MSEKQEKTKESKKDNSNNLMIWAIAIAAVLVLFNQWQIMQVNGLLTGTSVVASHSGSGGSLLLADGDKITYAPILLAAGESPVIAGYGTKIKQLQTISPTPKKPKTGDAVQDALNMIVPTGTPDYGTEIGVSFDDPITAQKKLGTLERSIKLDANQEARWKKIVGSFTCDYCCGSPQRPTIISHCGCAHAAAWRGLARFLIQKYNDNVTDEQIMGELSKWKALWYPGPTVQRVLQEQQLSGGKTDSAPVNIDKLPGMVGGC